MHLVVHLEGGRAGGRVGWRTFGVVFCFCLFARGATLLASLRTALSSCGVAACFGCRSSCSCFFFHVVFDAAVCSLDQLPVEASSYVP